MTDTIAALSSGPGRAAVAVIRISGPDAGRALAALAGPLPSPRRASLRTLKSATAEPLDQALVLWLPAPESFTGEDCAELHTHGGAAVVAAVLDALFALGLRPAEPGAFTRRAFENQKLDLTKAEAIADLVDAETEGQRRQALRQLEGGLARQVEAWRAQLLHALSLLEAAIDFPDEDLPENLTARSAPPLQSLADALQSHLQNHAGERVREGYRIAILGPPNAGKSSLLNALAQREAAIVSDIPGTTRDVVEIRLEIAGFPVWIADTAGLREAADQIEAEGVRRALARAEEADLRLGLIAPDVGGFEALAPALRDGDILIHAKADLLAQPAVIPGERPARDPGSRATNASEQAPGSRLRLARDDIRLSTKTGQGLDDLRASLAARIASDLQNTEAAPLTRARHRLALSEAEAALRRAIACLPIAAELAAEDVRLAGRALGRIAGRIDVEEVLGEIFAAFCIGK